MRFGFLPFLLAALPLLTPAADDRAHAELEGSVRSCNQMPVAPTGVPGRMSGTRLPMR